MSKADGGAPGGNLLDLLEEITGSPEFCADLVAAFDAALSAAMPPDKVEACRRAEFDQMVARVARDIRSHPQRDAMLQLFRDESRLTDDQVVSLFHFFYSGLVSHFKGQVAEALARPLLLAFASALQAERVSPERLGVLPGSDLFTPRPGHVAGRQSWKLGPDALIVVVPRGGDGVGETATSLLRIAGVVEVKSERVGVRKVTDQITGHFARLSLGARIGPQEFPADGVRFLVPGVSEGSSFPAPALYVRPRRERWPPAALSRTGGNLWTADLPCTKRDLMHAGFRLMDWFLGRVGAEVFGADLGLMEVRADEQIPNPWPEDSTEEAGRNALMERLHYLGMRGIFEEGGKAPTVNEHARQTYFWLYNSMGFGYSRARGDRRQSPSEHPALPRALVYPEARPASATDPQCLAAQAAYEQARFAAARAVFPDPGPKPLRLDAWWPQNLIMAARLDARTGNGAPARRRLALLEPLTRWPYSALPIEVHAVIALSWLADGDKAAAGAAAVAALAALVAVRRDRDERERNHQGDDPWLIPRAVQRGILDLAAVLVALGEPVAALEQIVPMGGVPEYMLGYIAADPLLGPLRQDPRTSDALERWMKTAMD